METRGGEQKKEVEDLNAKGVYYYVDIYKSELNKDVTCLIS